MTKGPMESSKKFYLALTAYFAATTVVLNP